MGSDRIEMTAELKAPVERVWRAIADFEEFGAWFGVKLEGPFAAGEEARGQITHPGYEHLVWRAVVQRIEPQRLFSFTWHPYAVDQAVDYKKEEPTLVEFRLEPTAEGGTRVTVTESGFSKVPAARREEAFLRNEGGWTQQMKNIERHVDG